jgi:hypothetical protein
MPAEPARTWAEVVKKWRFLLDRYAETLRLEMNAFGNSSSAPLADMERLKNLRSGNDDQVCGDRFRDKRDDG